jgi:hypothetical protein
MSSRRIWLKSRHSTDKANLFQLPLVNPLERIRNVAYLQERQYYDFGDHSGLILLLPSVLITCSL